MWDHYCFPVLAAIKLESNWLSCCPLHQLPQDIVWDILKLVVLPLKRQVVDFERIKEMGV